MLSSYSVVGFSLIYICILFGIAYVSDSQPKNQRSRQRSNLIYSLSIAVYCSSWTFYGAVGTAASAGFDYLAIYLGPCLVFLFGYPFIRQIIKICKASNITSISDFIASRFGRSRGIAVLVTMIAFIGSIPYIALQLKAISMSFLVLISGQTTQILTPSSPLSDTGLYVTGVLAVFTILFGTRHLDATEHHQGLITAVAFESIVKLFAILAVGYYCVFLLLDSLSVDNASFLQSGIAQESMSRLLNDGSSTWQSFLTKTILSIGAIVLLPRQFHVAIVEANDHRQFKTVSWIMPIYFILTSIVVLPIAITGILLMPGGQEDLYVLSLPLVNGNETLALIAFIGGFSAATGMVIVAAISLSTMISNDLVMPALLRWKGIDFLKRQDLSRLILLIRRVAIVMLLLTSYGFYGLIDTNQRLANIGLLAFAAIIQLLPAMIAALYWNRAHKKGVFWGLIGGFTLWLYCLLMPTLAAPEFLNSTFIKGSWFHPQALFGNNLSDSLTHGVFWSLLVNTGLLVFLSLRNEQGVVERVQASFFTHPVSMKGLNLVGIDEQQSILDGNISNMTADQLKVAMKLSEYPRIPVTIQSVRQVAERIIGSANTDALVHQFSNRHQVEETSDMVVDTRLLSQVHTAMAGVIGGASAQKVMTDGLLGGETFLGQASVLVDETSDVLKFNRNLMQTTLENISQGISVVDQNLNLVIWNSRYLELFEYPENLVYSGMPIRELLEFNANRGEFLAEDPKMAVKKRLQRLMKRMPYEHISTRKNGRVIKLTGEPMQGGGYVTTYQDITEIVHSAQMLREANEELENRVLERTLELEALTEELKRATKSKTHFLAAASHDLLQPINAARLFSHSIRQRKNDEKQVEKLASNVEQSLNNANSLLTALLDVSKLDAEGIQPEASAFKVQDLINDVRVEFNERAKMKGIELKVVESSCVLQTDRRLLFSVIQNFVSNAVRYTLPGDKVVIGVRHRGSSKQGDDRRFAEIQVLDSGVGIESEKITKITQEFYRIIPDAQDNNSQGLGLGLSIAKRIAKLLDSSLRVESEFGKGSVFSITVPLSDEMIIAPNVVKTDSIQQQASLQALTVLCIDNDPIVLESLVNVLEDWGCEVLPAADYDLGAEFLSEDVDVVLADYHLNDERSGADFLREKVSLFPNIRGVLITAAHDQHIAEMINDAGYLYMKKPVDVQKLKQLLQASRQIV
ncbi:MAG: PAS domain-containing hybrid sensor histidine kinase/response regulator [Arenicella sp.]